MPTTTAAEKYTVKLNEAATDEYRHQVLDTDGEVWNEYQTRIEAADEAREKNAELREERRDQEASDLRDAITEKLDELTLGQLRKLAKLLKVEV